MTDKQYRQLCEGIQSIGSGVFLVLNISTNLKPEDKYEAQRLGRIASIIADCNTLLHEFVSEIKTEG